MKPMKLYAFAYFQTIYDEKKNRAITLRGKLHSVVTSTIAYSKDAALNKAIGSSYEKNAAKVMKRYGKVVPITVTMRKGK